MSSTAVRQISVKSIKQMGLILPIFFVAILIGVLIERYIPSADIERWLGDQTWWAIPLAAVGGLAFPIPRYVTYPIAFALYVSGAGVGVAFALIGGEVVSESVVRDIMEIRYFGWRFFSARLVLSLLGLIVGGYLMEAIL